MKDRDCLALRVRSGRLMLLDQSRLPHVQDWFAVDDVATLVEAIHALRTRGAPMIAIAAAFIVAVRVEAGDDHEREVERRERRRGSKDGGIVVLELELNRAATAAPRHDELQTAELGRDAPPRFSLGRRPPVVVDKCECERELSALDLRNDGAVGVVGEVAHAGEGRRARSYVEGELLAIPSEAVSRRLHCVAEVERRHPVAATRQAEVPLGIFGRDVRAG